MAKERDSQADGDHQRQNCIERMRKAGTRLRRCWAMTLEVPHGHPGGSFELLDFGDHGTLLDDLAVNAGHVVMFLAGGSETMEPYTQTGV